jgi:hypothetical protein
MLYFACMEKFPKQGPVARKEPSVLHESGDAIEINTLTSSDIRSEDRAFIYTESGNRYMLRHSKSRGGALTIYNEREGGFSAESGHLFMIRKGNIAIAEVGKSLNYFAMSNEHKDNTGEEVLSTRVTRIELRRGLEARVARRAAEQEAEGGFGGIANVVKEAAGPRRRGRNDRS